MFLFFQGQSKYDINLLDKNIIKVKYYYQNYLNKHYFLSFFKNKKLTNIHYF